MTKVNIHKYSILLFILMIAGFTSCKKDLSAPPSITRVRANFPNPNDSTLSSAGPGQWIVIVGSNLASTREIYFNGYAGAFNNGIFSDTSMVVQIPADMPFATLDQSKLNTIRVVNGSGEITYSFPIKPDAPVITSMSNEMAVAGETVTIYGNNFFYIDKVVFPGNIAVTTGITTNNAGNTLTVTVPAGITTSGTISIVNRYGTGTSVLLFNDMTTGVIHNWDNVSNYSWGAGSSNSSATYPNNRGYYGTMNSSALNSGDFGWWNGNRSLNTNSGQWVPVANLSETLDKFAVKFEINVTSAWKGASIYILKDYSWTYVARYEPWLNNGAATDFTTNGWQTVVVPLSKFKKKANGLDGTGDPAASLTTLLGANGTGSIHFFLVNSGTATSTDIATGIDNIRVVRISN